MKKSYLSRVGVPAFFIFIFTASPLALAETGTAVIKGTAEGSSIAGKAVFQDTAEGLKVSVELNNVPPGKHGFHIHQYGACGDSGKAAGGHFNPDAVAHGLLLKDGFTHAHAGDLGNAEITPDGTGKVELILPGLSLSGGKYSVGGRSLILHEKEDDFGQPTGNAGGRIGCGTIEITGE